MDNLLSKNARNRITKSGIDDFGNFVIELSKSYDFDEIAIQQLRAFILTEYFKKTNILISDYIYYKIVRKLGYCLKQEIISDEPQEK